MRNRNRYVDQDLVFAGDLGEMLDLDAVSKAFAARASTLGIKVRGISLGHGDASTTLRMYAHLIEGEKAKVAASVGDAIRAAQARRAAGQK